MFDGLPLCRSCSGPFNDVPGSEASEVSGLGLNTASANSAMNSVSIRRNAMAALADPLLCELGAVDRREEVTDASGEQGGHPTGRAGRCKSEAWHETSSQPW